MQRGVWAGEKLEELLRERGMTQEQLGVLAGLRRTDVNRYVRNKQRLGVLNGRKLAEALSVTPEELGITESDNGDGPATTEQLARLEALLVEARERLERIEQRLDTAGQ